MIREEGMRRRNWMQGPRPINIGGTGRERRERKGGKPETGIRPERDAGSGAGTADCRHITGRKGEDIALRHLLSAGFRLLERNWRCSHKEIDLIMEHCDGLHIIEVKTRTEPAPVEPEQAVDRQKRRRLETAAGSYIKMTGRCADVHFDIVSVVLDKDGGILRISFMEDAFFPIKY